MSDERDSRDSFEEGMLGRFAHPPDGSPNGEDEEPWQPPPRGLVIRLMGDHGVTVPLWSDQDGLMFNEPGELIAESGASPALAADLEAWAIGWDRNADQPDHDAEAARLVRRLNQELGDRYRFVRRT